MTADLEDRLEALERWVQDMKRIFNAPEAPPSTHHLREHLQTLARQADALRRLAEEEGEDPEAVAAVYEGLMAQVHEVSKAIMLTRWEGGVQ